MQNRFVEYRPSNITQNEENDATPSFWEKSQQQHKNFMKTNAYTMTSSYASNCQV